MKKIAPPAPPGALLAPPGTGPGACLGRGSEGEADVRSLSARGMLAAPSAPVGSSADDRADSRAPAIHAPSTDPERSRALVLPAKAWESASCSATAMSGAIDLPGAAMPSTGLGARLERAGALPATGGGDDGPPACFPDVRAPACEVVRWTTAPALGTVAVACETVLEVVPTACLTVLPARFATVEVVVGAAAATWVTGATTCGAEITRATGATGVGAAARVVAAIAREMGAAAVVGAVACEIGAVAWAVGVACAAEATCDPAATAGEVGALTGDGACVETRSADVATCVTAPSAVCAAASPTLVAVSALAEGASASAHRHAKTPVPASPAIRVKSRRGV